MKKKPRHRAGANTIGGGKETRDLSVAGMILLTAGNKSTQTRDNQNE